MFLDAIECTFIAIATFAVSSLRSLAHDNLLSKEDAEEVLTLPMRGPKARELRKKHEALVKRFRTRDYDELINPYIGPRERDPSLVIHHVGDEKADSECVHLIAVDTKREIIALSFRGSITYNDWVQ